MQLTDESVQAARDHFVSLQYACITEAVDGRAKVNDLESYCEDCLLDALRLSLGHWDHTFTLRQYATYLQTGTTQALLP